MASLSTKTGSPTRELSSSRTATSANGTLTDVFARPVANSTTEGIPTPTAATSSVRTRSMAPASSSSSASGSVESVGSSA